MADAVIEANQGSEFAPNEDDFADETDEEINNDENLEDEDSQDDVDVIAEEVEVETEEN